MNNPYAPPSNEASAVDAFNPSRPYGGLSRRVFNWLFFGMLCLPFTLSMMGMFDRLEGIIRLANVVFLLIVAGYRCKNIGVSQWWALAMIVPILNLFVIHRCIACQTGWIETRQLDRPGVIGSIVFWCLVLLTLVAALVGV